MQFALRYKGPYGKERQDLDKLNFEASVRVYREKSREWNGPFKFISKEGETIVVQMPHGRRIFRSNVLRSVLDGEQEETSQDVINVMFGAEDHVYINQTDEHNFRQSRKKEITGFLEAGVFEIVDRKDVPKGTRIYGSRWIDTLKRGQDGQAVEKSRLVAQN